MSKISIEEVKERLTSFGIEMLSENYMGMRKKHVFKCKECGEPFETYMKHVMYESKHICNTCSNKNVSEKYKGRHLIFDYENLLERLDKLNLKMKYPKKYKIEDEVIFICECGNEFTTKLKYALYEKKSKCDECTSKKITNEEFVNKVYEKVQDEYIFLEGYNGTKFPIKVRHNKCGHEYKIAPYNFLTLNYKCRCSRVYKGEEQIRKVLKLHNIAYKEQYKIEECRYKKQLPFDFAIFNEDGSLKCLIEYDGEGHFKPLMFHKMSKEDCLDNFEVSKLRDNIKTKYCKNNNINLIRIPYTEFDNIEEILKNII